MLTSILTSLSLITTGKSVDDTIIDTIINQNYTESTIATSTSSDNVEGHLMDDILPGTKPPSHSVIFIDVPTHSETELGASVLLPCRTAFPVTECQWSWQPLPPTHLPLPDISDSSIVPTCK